MSLSGPRASFVLQRERVNLLLAQLQHPLQRSAGASARQRSSHSENEIQPLIFRGNPTRDFFILWATLGARWRFPPATPVRLQDRVFPQTSRCRRKSSPARTWERTPQPDRAASWRCDPRPAVRQPCAAVRVRVCVLHGEVLLVPVEHAPTRQRAMTFSGVALIACDNECHFLSLHVARVARNVSIGFTDLIALSDRAIWHAVCGITSLHIHEK